MTNQPINGMLSQNVPQAYLEPLSPGEVELPLQSDGFPVNVGAGVSDVKPQFQQQIPQVQQYQQPVQQQYQQPVQQQVQQPVQAPEPTGYVYDNSIPEDILEDMENMTGDISALFPANVTQDMINSWKQRYREVYVVNILDRVWFYRPILRNEYLAIMANSPDRSSTEESIASTCSIWPKMDTLSARGDCAGIATALCDYILKMSGFAPTSIPVKL